MPKKFKNGTKDEIISIACIWAIENIESMIDGVSPDYGNSVSEDTQTYIDDLNVLKEDIELLMQSVRRSK